ncbi:serine hydrolase domain-containing protein [Pyruvatibacter sp.]|uniref:serine hydrolase domain-containing protein n=1 Tax=Pyruvatibacter sp. TaxID=1981328 RepID=UPI0032ED2213
MTTIHGTCAPAFERARDQFADNFQNDLEIGASFCVIHKGKTVVDLWAGDADETGATPWAHNTLANVWSTTKGVSAICIALLVDRGLLSYDDTVATHWPEFAAHGKGGITVAQMLSHQAGLSGLREPTTLEDCYDHDLMAQRLAAQEPLWEPTTRSGYHAFTYGYLAAELVKRITGKTIGKFLRDELGTPHGIDFFIGLPISEEPRVAPLSEATDMQPLSGTTEIQNLTFANPAIGQLAPNDRAWRAAELPAAGGFGSASALAKLYALLDDATAPDGKAIISRATMDALRTTRIQNEDLILGVPVRWGSGMAMNGFEMYGPNDQAFGHTGWGGSFGCLDPEAGIAIGYVMNRMGAAVVGDPRSMGLVAAVFACV